MASGGATGSSSDSSELTSLSHFDNVSSITIGIIAESSDRFKEYYVGREATDNTPLFLITLSATGTMRLSYLNGANATLNADNLHMEALSTCVFLDQGKEDCVTLGYIESEQMVSDSKKNPLVAVKIDKLTNCVWEVYFNRINSDGLTPIVLSPDYAQQSALLRFPKKIDCVTKVVLIAYALKFSGHFYNTVKTLRNCDGSLGELKKIIGVTALKPPVQCDKKFEQVQSYGILDTEPLLKVNQVSIEMAAEHYSLNAAYFYIRDDEDDRRLFYIIEKHYEPTELAVVRSVKFADGKVFYLDKFSHNFSTKVFFDEREIGQVVDPGIIIHNRRNIVLEVRVRNITAENAGQNALVIVNNSTQEFTTAVISHMEERNRISIKFYGSWDMEWRALIYATAINLLDFHTLYFDNMPKVQRTSELAAMANKIAQPQPVLCIEPRLKAIELPSPECARSPLNKIPELDKFYLFTLEQANIKQQKIYKLWDAERSLLLGFFQEQDNGELLLTNKAKSKSLLQITNVRLTHSLAFVFAPTANEQSTIGYLSSTEIYNSYLEKVFYVTCRYVTSRQREFQVTVDEFTIAAQIYDVFDYSFFPARKCVRVKINAAADCIVKALILCYAVKVFLILMEPWGSAFPSKHVPVDVHSDTCSRMQELFMFPLQLQQFPVLNLWPLAYSIDEKSELLTNYNIFRDERNSPVCLVHTRSDENTYLIDLSHSNLLFAVGRAEHYPDKDAVYADVDGYSAIIGYLTDTEILDENMDPLFNFVITRGEHYYESVQMHDGTTLATFTPHHQHGVVQIAMPNLNLLDDQNAQGLIICCMLRSFRDYIKNTSGAKLIDDDLKHVTQLALDTTESDIIP